MLFIANCVLYLQYIQETYSMFANPCMLCPLALTQLVFIVKSDQMDPTQGYFGHFTLNAKINKTKLKHYHRCTKSTTISTYHFIHPTQLDTHPPLLIILFTTTSDSTIKPIPSQKL
ncbi:hypothetical protein Hanom_Chr08g00719951 [Helianthus anomalus]